MRGPNLLKPSLPSGSPSSGTTNHCTIEQLPPFHSRAPRLADPPLDLNIHKLTCGYMPNRLSIARGPGRSPGSPTFRAPARPMPTGAARWRLAAGRTGRSGEWHSRVLLSVSKKHHHHQLGFISLYFTFILIYFKHFLLIGIRD